MSNAALLADAIDATITIARAYALWLLALAVIGSLLLLATIAATAWTVRAAWRGVTAALRAVQRQYGAPDRQDATEAPHAHTADHSYEEAA